MYRVSNKFREQAYSGEALYNANLVINGVTVPNEQIASITISDPIIDTSVETFYLGSFISKQITIKFKNLDGLTIETGLNVYLEIGQEIDGEYEYVPIGNFLIDDLDENYYTTCEITCLDYAVLFKPAVDYSPAFSDGKATIDDILIWLCRHFGVELGEYPTINGDVEIGVYDGSISGKQWISYIAEIKGCNAKIDRTGTLQLIPFNNTSQVTIDATTNEEWEVGEPYSISRIIYYDAVRNYTFGDTTANTLYIRQDNPFIVDSSVVENIYDNIFITSKTASGETINISDGSTTTTGKLIIQGNMSQYQDEGDAGVTAEGTSLEINDVDTNKVSQVTLQGNTYQNNYDGIQLYNYNDKKSVSDGITTDNEGWITINIDNSSGTGNKFSNYWTHDLNLQTATPYAIFLEVKSVSGTGSIYVVSTTNGTQSQFPNNINLNFASLQAGSIHKYILTTASTFTGDNGLRTFALAAAGQNGSITFRLSVYADTSISTDDFVYEAYTGEKPAPNPEYQQNIYAVTGQQEVDITNKNLFIPTLINNGTNISVSNCTVSLENDEYSLTATGSDMYFSQVTSSGNVYTNNRGPLYEVKDAERIYIYLTNNTFAKNYITWYDKNKISLGYNQIASSTGSLEVPINAKYFTFRFGIGQALSGTTYKTKVMVSYEPIIEYTPYHYHNYKVNLGKNLFDGEISSGRWSITVGSVISSNSNTGYRSQNAINILPNTKYTMSGTINVSGGYIVETDDNNIVLAIDGNRGYMPISYTNNVPFSFTFNSHPSAKHLYWYIANSNPQQPINLMVELGTTSSEYVPYIEPIELCQIEDYQDYFYKDSNKWFLHKEINKLVLNGNNNEDWRIFTTNTTGKNRWRLSYENIYYSTGGNVVVPIYCDKLIQNSPNDTYRCNQGIAVDNASQLLFYIDSVSSYNLTQFKEWLSNNNLTVYFILETPTNTEITNQTLINELNNLYNAQLLEETNIDAYSNTLEANINVRYNIILPTPTSDLPSEVKTVTGDNTFVIHSKNLCPSLPTGTNNGVNFVKKENGSTDIIGTSNDIINYNAITNKLLKKGTYTLSVEMSVLNPINSSQILMRKMTGESIATINLWNLQSQTITLEEDTLIRIYFYSNSNKTYDTNIKIQLEESTSATAYQSYFRDEYELNLGKNLFDTNNILVGKNVNYATGEVFDQTGRSTLDYTKIKSNTNYIVSGLTIKNTVFYDKSKIFISSVQDQYSFTTPLNACYLRFGFDNTQSYSQAQLEEGTTATEYAPYIEPIELCKLNGKQDYFHKVGEDWYIHKEIGKIVFDGTESGWDLLSVLTNTTAYQRNVDIGYNKTTGNSANAYVNYFKGLPNGYEVDDECFWFNNQGYFMIRINTLKASTQPEFRNWLSNNNVIVYYELEENEEIKITDNILINQLNEIYNIHLHNGTNIIEVETINKNPELDLLYFIPIDFTIYSLKAKNYGDISLDAYDIIDYTIQDEGENVKHYLTYNNNTTTYEMNISSTVDTQISNKQKEVTTNHIGGDIPTKVKMLKTDLDHVNNRIEMLVEEQDEQSAKLNQTIIDINSTRNIFQITGGSNLIKNSQFLYDDPEIEEDNVRHRTYWDLTDNGTNPFNNLGDGYDSSLIGQTVSLAKIQLRNTILQSRDLNITDLQIGQVYTLNYFYRQENLTTTRLELFDANNNHVTYDIVNEETGITETKNIDITYEDEQTRITNQSFKFIAPTSTLKLKITTSTTSGETSNGNFYLYDLMLNSGDKKSWELASSEIYSTTIQMSNLGLQVITADENIATLLTAQGFQVVKYDDGRFGAIVTSFTKKGIKTDEIESNLISTGKFVMTEATINNNEHHIEYFVD